MACDDADVLVPIILDGFASGQDDSDQKDGADEVADRGPVFFCLWSSHVILLPMLKILDYQIYDDRRRHC